MLISNTIFIAGLSLELSYLLKLDLILVFVTFYIILAVLFFVYVALMQLAIKLVRGKGSLGKTFMVICYSSSPINFVSLLFFLAFSENIYASSSLMELPWLGLLASIPYIFYLVVVGISVSSEISGSRALAALMIQLFIFPLLPVILYSVPVYLYKYGAICSFQSSECFLLVEEWHTTEGHIISGNRSDIPLKLIDFPMYDVEEGNKKIWVPFIRDDLKDLSNVSIIFGYGKSLEGDIGGGISSSLSTFEEFPLHINRSGYSIDIISNDRVLINNNIEIPPGGQHLFISNYTENYGNTTVNIQHTIRIKNYGNYPKDSFYT